MIRLYLERTILQGRHEKLRLAAKDCFVEIEMVWPADDLAVRESLGVMKPVREVSSDNRAARCACNLHGEAFLRSSQGVHVCHCAFFDGGRASHCEVSSGGAECAVASSVLRRLVANLRDYRLASSAVARSR
jgi:hypothetical protein